MRCFVAIELDQALRGPLVRMLREKLPRTRDVRWCTEDQLHLTLKFLGDVRDEQIPAVCESIAAAAGEIEPFALCLAGLGCFPSARNPRVFWCGVEDAARGCARWLTVADALFEDLGFPPEQREFHPHVTLGRGKTAAGAGVIRRVLEEVAAPPAREMKVNEVVLFESRLSPQGARYLPQFRARLGE
jgi:2'-5' RNA ligase